MSELLTRSTRGLRAALIALIACLLLSPLHAQASSTNRLSRTVTAAFDKAAASELLGAASDAETGKKGAPTPSKSIAALCLHGHCGHAQLLPVAIAGTSRPVPIAAARPIWCERHLIGPHVISEIYRPPSLRP